MVIAKETGLLGGWGKGSILGNGNNGISSIKSNDVENIPITHRTISSQFCVFPL